MLIDAVCIYMTLRVCLYTLAQLQRLPRPRLHSVCRQGGCSVVLTGSLHCSRLKKDFSANLIDPGKGKDKAGAEGKDKAAALP